MAFGVVRLRRIPGVVEGRDADARGERKLDHGIGSADGRPVASPAWELMRLPFPIGAVAVNRAPGPVRCAKRTLFMGEPPVGGASPDDPQANLAWLKCGVPAQRTSSSKNLIRSKMAVAPKAGKARIVFEREGPTPAPQLVTSLRAVAWHFGAAL